MGNLSKAVRACRAGRDAPRTTLLADPASRPGANWTSSGSRSDFRRCTARIAAEAARIDARIAAAWDGHPRRTFIESTERFVDKVSAALAALQLRLRGLQPPVLVQQTLADAVEELLRRREPNEVSVTLPRFKLTQRSMLNEALQSLGMTSLFSPGEADLSGIAEGQELCVNKVIHEATVEVNEEGTVAAAATAVVAAICFAAAPAGPPGLKTKSSLSTLS